MESAALDHMPDDCVMFDKTVSKRNSPVISLALVLLYVIGGAAGDFALLNMSRPAQAALVILLTAATLWITEAVPLFVTSFIVLGLSLVWLKPLLESTTGETVEASLFLAPSFSDVIVLFLGGFVLSAALHKHRLDERLAQFLLSRTGGSVPWLILGVMAITALLSMWLSNTATAAMMLALCLPIIERLPQDDRYRKAILLAVPFAANVGGLGTPIGSPPNAIALQYMQQLQGAPSFGFWMLIAVPGVGGLLLLAWAVLLVMYRGQVRYIALDASPVEIHDRRQAAVVVVVAVLTALAWMTGELHGYSSDVVAMLPIIAYFGLGILSVRDLRSLAWDVLLLMGGGLCLGSAIDSSGLADWLVEHLPVDETGLYGLILVFGIAGTAMSSVMSNTATANLLLPIVMGMSIATPSPLLAAVAFACTLAMPLPVSTPPNAMAFASGELHVQDMFKPGLIITVVGLALTLTIGYWWWGVVGLF